MPDLLIELFSEEIPARMQPRAAADLKRLVTDGLVEAGLTYAGAEAFATPRRLALALTGLPAQTPARREERKGPRVDAPEKALEGFLRSTGLTRDELEARDDKKGQVWFAVIDRPGRPAEEVIAEVLETTIRGFPWPRSMRWGSGNLRWVRPLHAILCLLSEEGQEPRIVPFEIEGLTAGDSTEGHRFMAPGRVRVRDFEDYAAKLEAAKVILDPEARADTIRHDAAQLAFARGLEVVEDEALLREVAGLVEWPVTLMGPIEEEFLSLPPEVLQTSMKEHQKFFSARNPDTGRIEAFVTVANIAAPDGGKAILAGNRRVLAARLADAAFFWENDRRKSLDEMAAPLAEVTFHNKLGTQAERIERIAALAREIAPMVGADPDRAERAARIAKADLASEMVYEFPELQGVMGRYYALEAGEPAEVADAARDHYAPLGPSDAVPTAPVTVAVALADKIDMLTGFWAIDEKPTGSKDPFALRRAALGVIRIVLSNELRIGLGRPLANSMLSSALSAAEVIAKGSIAEFPPEIVRILGEKKFFEIVGEIGEKLTDTFSDRIDARGPTQVYDLLSFFADRLKVHLRDRGIRHDVVDACFQLEGQDDLWLLVQRVEALQAFLDTEDGANLLTAYRRAANIVEAEEKKDGVEYSYPPDPKFAELPEEEALFAALDASEPEIAAALTAEDFAAAMGHLAALRAPIDAFFDKVTVNVENPIVRRNRLCLLTRVREIMHRVAIFSAIEG